MTIHLLTFLYYYYYLDCCSMADGCELFMLLGWPQPCVDFIPEIIHYRRGRRDVTGRSDSTMMPDLMPDKTVVFLYCEQRSAFLMITDLRFSFWFFLVNFMSISGSWHFGSGPLMMAMLQCKPKKRQGSIHFNLLRRDCFLSEFGIHV